MTTHHTLSLLAGLGLTLSACTAAQVPAVTPAVVEHERASLEAQAKAQAEEQLARVQRVGKQLLTGIPYAPQIEFSVIPDEGRINVGADTQEIVVTSGLLQFLHSDDELAAVLGHEIAHVMQGHITQGRVARADMRQVPTAEETGGEAVPGPDEDREKANPGQFFSHQFTRRQELEADALGFRYMGTAGYNPQSGGAVWEQWAGEPPQTGTADLFASHPSSPERSASARKVLAKLPSVSRDSAPVAAVAAVDVPSQAVAAPEPMIVPEPLAVQQPVVVPEPAAVQQPVVVPEPLAVQQPVVVPVTAPPPAPRQSLADSLDALDQLYYQGQITAAEYWRQRDALVR